MEEGHFVADGAVAFSQAGRLFVRRLGRDNGRWEREVDLVFLEATVAGAVIEAAGGGRSRVYLRGLSRHLRLWLPR